MPLSPCQYQLILSARLELISCRANYFLLRNGEYSLSLIREIDRLKISRLTTRSGPTSMIREQDLNLALLRASLGTSAQHDPSLSHLRFSLPSGPLRPLLPSLLHQAQSTSPKSSNHLPGSTDPSLFTSHLLGTPLNLTYTVSWPLDLFLHPTDLAAYGSLFAFLSSLRKTHTRIHNCWSSLSNAQRARRRWTGLGEGGTVEDLQVRRRLLRCGWGIVRDMGWFLDTLLGYLMMDVVDVEYVKLRATLGPLGCHANRVESTMPPSATNASLSSTRNSNKTAVGKDAQGTHGKTKSNITPSASDAFPASTSTSSNISASSPLDFTTLRTIHANYLDRLLTGCLLTNPALTSILQPMLEVCERFVAQVERWGGDVLPALLFEGSLKGGDEEVGAMVKERLLVAAEIDTVRVITLIPVSNKYLIWSSTSDLAGLVRVIL